jgi:hypothetical protein
MKNSIGCSTALMNESFVKSILLIVFIFLYYTGKSQTNIELPTTLASVSSPAIPGGASALEALRSNGYLFIYTSDGILVYSEIDNKFLKKIPFNEDIDFGKFNPVYFNDRLSFGDASLMAVSENKSTLYVIFPDLKIKGISINPEFNVTGSFDPFITNPPPGSDPLPSYFSPLHGACILKLDPVHNRLFWIVYAGDPSANEECPGNFHTLSRYFAILDISPFGNISWYYAELLEGGQDYFDRSITDIEFNDIESYNIFYLSKFNKIEVWRVIGNNMIDSLSQVTVDPTIYGYNCNIGQGSLCPYKIGKMLYVHSNNNHQIIALPYKFPSSSLQENKVPLVYVLDAAWNGIGDIPYATFTAPSEKISDGIFISNLNDLVLSYADDTNVYRTWPGTDISIFRSISGLNYTHNQSFNTDYSSKISDYDINTSFNLVRTYGTPPVIFIGKKDGISKLAHNGEAPPGDSYIPSNVLVAESNFFRNGITGGNSGSYFLNNVMNGIVKFDNNELVAAIPMAYPVYGIAGNSAGTKLYFFHTLQSFQTGLYIYDGDNSININYDGFSNNDIDKPVGDCIFNPFTNQFLVSECADFGQNPAVIRVINDNGANTWAQDIELADNAGNYQYPKEMFITPDGKLYVLVNMHRQQYGTPELLEFTACDQSPYSAYTFLRSHDLSVPPVPEESDFFSGHFAYDSRDGSVYVTVHPTELTLDPYNSVVNSIYDFPAPTPEPGTTGSLTRINKNNNYLPKDLWYPGKIICPGSEYPQIPSKFAGKTYVIGKYFYEYDMATDDVTQFIDQPFNDITYSPLHDKMYAIRDVGYEPCGDNRNCEVYCIDKVDGTLIFTLFDNNPQSVIPGQVSSITFNPYDGKIYLYNKLDNFKLGQVHGKVVIIDPEAEDWQPSSIELPFLSLHPEMDHQPDKHYYMYNITKPLIDPVNNCIYFANGGHSSVTRIEFDPRETTPLDPSLVTWLSFPRLDRSANVNTVNDVLDDNISPSNYRPGSILINLPPGTSGLIFNEYNGSVWPENADLYKIDSRYGYKLQLLYDPENMPEKEWLHLFGEVIDAATPLNVDCRYENWIGYWLYEKQSPFTAFPEFVLDKTRIISAQHWMCVKFSSTPGYGGTEPPSYWGCACHEGKVELKYGDMVILRPEFGTDNFNFQWLRYGNPVVGQIRPSTEYFLYQEQPDYVPYLVELDSTQLPDEIGAFVNDTCVGATAVLPGDTVVLVPGYVEGISGDVTFQLYYDSLKSSPKAVPEYWVENPRNRMKNRTTLHSSDRQDYFLISFRNDGQENTVTEVADIRADPNPAKEQWRISFYLPEAGAVSIQVFDLFGNRWNAVSESWFPAGFHSFELKVSDMAGYDLNSGVFLLRLQGEGYCATTKLVLVR